MKTLIFAGMLLGLLIATPAFAKNGELAVRLVDEDGSRWFNHLGPQIAVLFETVEGRTRLMLESVDGDGMVIFNTDLETDFKYINWKVVGFWMPHCIGYYFPPKEGTILANLDDDRKGPNTRVTVKESPYPPPCIEP